MTELSMIPDVIVRVVFDGGEPYEFAFSEMVAGRSEATPADISDDEMIRLAANQLDRTPADFRNMVVSRPASGNVLIAPKAEYGS